MKHRWHYDRKRGIVVCLRRRCDERRIWDKENKSMKETGPCRTKYNGRVTER